MFARSFALSALLSLGLVSGCIQDRGPSADGDHREDAAGVPGGGDAGTTAPEPEGVCGDAPELTSIGETTGMNPPRLRVSGGQLSQVPVGGDGFTPPVEPGLPCHVAGGAGAQALRFRLRAELPATYSVRVEGTRGVLVLLDRSCRGALTCTHDGSEHRHLSVALEAGESVEFSLYPAADESVETIEVSVSVPREDFEDDATPYPTVAHLVRGADDGLAVVIQFESDWLGRVSAYPWVHALLRVTPDSAPIGIPITAVTGGGHGLRHGAGHLPSGAAALPPLGPDSTLQLADLRSGEAGWVSNSILVTEVDPLIIYQGYCAPDLLPCPEHLTCAGLGFISGHHPGALRLCVP